MKDKIIYVHIGTPKTGSTSIQYFLWNNYEVLRKNGVLFPKSCLTQTSSYGNRSAAHSTFLHDFDKACKNLKQEITVSKNIHTVLLSCEQFGPRIRFISDLSKQLFKNNVIKIIIYLRRQDKYLESLYKEAVAGTFARFAEDFTTYYYTHTEAMRPDYYQLLQPWADCFGHENIIVRPFEKKQFYGGNLIRDFLHHTCIDDIENFQNLEIYNENISIPCEVVRLMSHLNAIPMQAATYREFCAYVYKNLLDGFEFDKNAKFVSPQAAIEIISTFDESNQKVAKKYLDIKNGILFNEPLPDLTETWSYPSYGDPRLQSILFQTFLTYQQRDPDFQKMYQAPLNINHGLKAYYILEQFPVLSANFMRYPKLEEKGISVCVDVSSKQSCNISLAIVTSMPEKKYPALLVVRCDGESKALKGFFRSDSDEIGYYRYLSVPNGGFRFFSFDFELPDNTKLIEIIIRPWRNTGDIYVVMKPNIRGRAIAILILLLRGVFFRLFGNFGSLQSL